MIAAEGVGGATEYIIPVGGQVVHEGGIVMQGRIEVPGRALALAQGARMMTRGEAEVYHLCNNRPNLSLDASRI